MASRIASSAARIRRGVPGLSSPLLSRPAHRTPARHCFGPFPPGRQHGGKSAGRAPPPWPRSGRPPPLPAMSRANEPSILPACSPPLARRSPRRPWPPCRLDPGQHDDARGQPVPQAIDGLAQGLGIGDPHVADQHRALADLGRLATTDPAPARGQLGRAAFPSRGRGRADPAAAVRPWGAPRTAPRADVRPPTPSSLLQPAHVGHGAADR